ncbi:hypothetical protein QE152_g31430 [Popillia japonica]|uniref:Reverse transcriptase domain-containing protein n=1 Tax=Popillia japonica TaxID=7064 RepID=A0AAW1J128_POPJA
MESLQQLMAKIGDTFIYGNLSEHQYGFREVRQTTDAILEVCKIVDEAADFSHKHRRLWWPEERRLKFSAKYNGNSFRGWWDTWSLEWSYAEQAASTSTENCSEHCEDLWHHVNSSTVKSWKDVIHQPFWWERMAGGRKRDGLNFPPNIMETVFVVGGTPGLWNGAMQSRLHQLQRKIAVSIVRTYGIMSTQALLRVGRMSSTNLFGGVGRMSSTNLFEEKRLKISAQNRKAVLLVGTTLVPPEEKRNGLKFPPKTGKQSFWLAQHWFHQKKFTCTEFPMQRTEKAHRIMEYLQKLMAYIGDPFMTWWTALYGGKATCGRILELPKPYKDDVDVLVVATDAE